MTSCGLESYGITVIASHCCGHCTLYAGKHGNFGKVHIQGEEVADNKFDIFLQLAANNLDKKDFFGKVCAKLQYTHTYNLLYLWTPNLMKGRLPILDLVSFHGVCELPVYIHLHEWTMVWCGVV